MDLVIEAEREIFEILSGDSLPDDSSDDGSPDKPFAFSGVGNPASLPEPFKFGNIRFTRTHSGAYSLDLVIAMNRTSVVRSILKKFEDKYARRWIRINKDSGYILEADKEPGKEIPLVSVSPALPDDRRLYLISIGSRGTRAIVLEDYSDFLDNTQHLRNYAEDFINFGISAHYCGRRNRRGNSGLLNRLDCLKVVLYP